MSDFFYEDYSTKNFHYEDKNEKIYLLRRISHLEDQVKKNSQQILIQKKLFKSLYQKLSSNEKVSHLSSFNLKKKKVESKTTEDYFSPIKNSKFIIEQPKSSFDMYPLNSGLINVSHLNTDFNYKNEEDFSFDEYHAKKIENEYMKKKSFEDSKYIRSRDYVLEYDQFLMQGNKELKEINESLNKSFEKLRNLDV